MATQNDTTKSGSGANGEALPPQHRKVALISGIDGQVGSYLTEFLLDKGCEVYGFSHLNNQRVDHIYIDPHNNAVKASMKLRCCILTDSSLSLRRCIDAISPDEVYNLADQYEAAVSLEIPEYPADAVAKVAVRLLEAVRSHVSVTGRSHIRYFQSGSSEMFGPKSLKPEYREYHGGKFTRPPLSETSRYLQSGSSERFRPRYLTREYWEKYGGKFTRPPLSETSRFHPWSLYGVSKLAAHFYTVHYREAHGLFACNGILFNPESPRQDWNFVIRKITRAVGRIKMGLQSELFLGTLDASRDWGFAGDYVEAMWMMLQHEKPDDYVIATGEYHTVDELMKVAFKYVGLEWEDYVVYDSNIPLRPVGTNQSKGDASKAKKMLGWYPKVGFEKSVEMMVDGDMELAKREKILVDTGYIDVSNSRALGHFERSDMERTLEALTLSSSVRLA